MRDDAEQETPLGEALERAIATLREPISVSPDFDAGVMRRVRHAAPPVPARTRGATRASLRYRPYRLAMAAGLVIAVIGAAVTVRETRSATARSSLPAVRFTLVAPGAQSVSVVGDFNHWNATASPLSRSRRGSGTWATTVRMTPGRHVYSFLVDGNRWVVDAHAPRSLDDDFGQPSAVLTVLRHST